MFYLSNFKRCKQHRSNNLDLLQMVISGIIKSVRGVGNLFTVNVYSRKQYW